MKNTHLFSASVSVSALALALAFSPAALAQTTLTDADIANAYQEQAITGRLSCHDPSIVVDDVTDPSSPTYYVYGSHLGHGKTTQAANYQQWDDSWAAYEVGGTANSLFANASGVRINFKDAYSSQAFTGKVKDYRGQDVDFVRFDAHAWQAKGNNVKGMEWAPDVIYNKTSKQWMMYMSLNGDRWCSSIVLFTADSPEGPWVYQGPVVMSGFQGSYDHNGYTKTDDWQKTDLALATGATSLPQRYNVGDHWGSFWPNCIDPCVFYDDNNTLWMTYGSWSGGIFMLKLDAATGLRDYTYTYPYEVSGRTTTPGAANQNCTSDPYFGKKIAGGWYVSGEGSYVQKIGNYYFLFMSYGGLNPSEGYQMRVFRSEKPDGPYVDANGVSALYNGYMLNYGSGAQTKRGVMLMNGYQWETMPVGEVAQGHNSAFVDDKGRAFVVYHTKFNNGGYGHEVRVHQLFLNEDGWLVASPYEFSGSTLTDDAIASRASVADADIAGSYQLIEHYYNRTYGSGKGTTTAELQRPKTITLNEDGTVTGSTHSGTWKRTPNTDYITLHIDNRDFKGVLVNQTVDYTTMPSLNIAAVSSSANEAREIWASKIDAKAAIKYTVDHYQAPFADGATINKDVLLPVVKGYFGATATWTSSDENVYDADFGEPVADGPVVLTLNISKDGYTYTKEYRVTVDMDGKASTPVYYPKTAVQNTTNKFFTSFSQAYSLKKDHDAEFKFMNYSDKAQNWDNWILVLSNVAHGATGYKEYVVLRADNYGWTPTANSGDDHSWFTSMTSDYNWDTFKDDMDGSQVDMTCSYATDGVFTMKAVITTAAAKKYNYSFVMPIPGAPQDLTVFFSGENSYIDGSKLATGIKGVFTGSHSSNFNVQRSEAYNLQGQRVGDNYKGVVIVNGKKVIR